MLKARSLQKFTLIMAIMMLMSMMFTIPQVSAAGTVHHVATQAQFDAIKDSTFAAGDQILLARGATFTGPLTPHGSGTASAPIIIGAEGTGALPIIKLGAVTGTTSISAIYLLNVSGYQISNIEVVGNYSSSTDSRGIWVKNTIELMYIIIQYMQILQLQ